MDMATLSWTAILLFLAILCMMVIVMVGQAFTHMLDEMADMDSSDLDDEESKL